MWKTYGYKNLPKKGIQKLLFDSYSFSYDIKIDDPKLPRENRCRTCIIFLKFYCEPNGRQWDQKKKDLKDTNIRSYRIKIK
jgi:hypothetical protein